MQGRFAIRIGMLIGLAAAGFASSGEPVPTPPATHVVRPGETLAALARQYYGDEHVSRGIRAILDANPHIGRGPGIRKELTVTIPELKTQTGSETERAISPPPDSRSSEPKP